VTIAQRASVWRTGRSLADKKGILHPQMKNISELYYILHRNESLMISNNSNPATVLRYLNRLIAHLYSIGVTTLDSPVFLPTSRLTP
jgi:hypothetical protein